MTDIFANRVLRWFKQHGRHDLPWQQNPTPYRVWVSEIMLQQTQVSTVIPFYHRFMQRFPTLGDLADADRDTVLAHWTGLGYYARARHLHETAMCVKAQFNGELPTTVEALVQLPGIGRSTAGAIVSLSGHGYAPILDGNVKRVLTRCFAIKGYPDSPATLKQLWQLSTELTPTKQCNAFNQAMMDLGATVCTRSKPACNKCPLQLECLATLTDTISQYPERKRKTIRPAKSTRMLLIQNQHGDILLEKRADTRLWGDLWSLPECSDQPAVDDYCGQLGVSVQHSELLPTFRHEFSHFTLDITPQLIQIHTTTTLKRRMTSATRVWYNGTQAPPGGFPAPVVKLLKHYYAKN